MNNITFMVIILGIGILIAINLILILSAWAKLSKPLGQGSKSMVLIYTASILSYIILSTILIILIVGFILYLADYGKADNSFTKYLIDMGYSDVDASNITQQIGPEGVLFYKDTMIKDIDDSTSVSFQFNTSIESFKSIMIMIYTFGIAIIFLMGLIAIIIIDPNQIPNNSGYGLLTSSVVVSGLSLFVIFIIYYRMYVVTNKKMTKLQEDQAHIASLINKSENVVQLSNLESGFTGMS